MEGIQCIACDYEESLTCPSCGSYVCVFCIDECTNPKCQFRCCAMCHRGCQGCGMEIICGHCSHTCESCSMTDLCKECITTYPLTDDGKTQCIQCAPPESDSSDDTCPTQTGPYKRQKTHYHKHLPVDTSSLKGSA